MSQNPLYEQRAVREKACPRLSCRATKGTPCWWRGAHPHALLHPHKERYDLVLADVRDQGAAGW